MAQRRPLAGAWVVRLGGFCSLLCIGGILALAFRLHPSCLTGDDFNNLYWAMREDGWYLLKASVNPRSDYNRPLAMLAYWSLLQGTGASPVAQHWAAFGLHAVNTALVFSILRVILRSRAGAAVGSVMFAYRVNFSDLFWSFGRIELLVAPLFLSAFRLYLSRITRAVTVPAVALLYLLALSVKEMAITLPLVLAMYEVSVVPSAPGRKPRPRLERLLPIGLLVAIGLSFGAGKLGNAIAAAPGGAHRLDISPPVFVQGLGWYLDLAFGTSLSWPWWCAAVVGALGFLWRFSRQGFFLLAYALVCLLPVIFLANHRFAFYWYLPFLGLAGLAGMAGVRLQGLLRSRLPLRAAVALGSAVFLAFASSYFGYQAWLSRHIRSSDRQTCHNHEAFMEGIRALPSPTPGTVLYFSSIPPSFNEAILRSAVQVSLRRTDVDTQVVTTPPPNARYRLRFERSAIVADPERR